jgi:hypothetical protein
MRPEETQDAVVFKRSVQPLQWGAQVVLLASFGGMLGLMLFAGIDSLRALRQVQSRNVQIRQTFLLRNRALEEIRSALYQSGTFTRDYLLERDAARAETYRASLQQVRGKWTRRWHATPVAGCREEAPFQACRPASPTIGKLLDPIFHWDAREKAGPQRRLSCTGAFPGAPPPSKSPTASPRSTSRNSTTATSG